eukprot:605583-Rhodomonas_salina.1
MRPSERAERTRGTPSLDLNPHFASRVLPTHHALNSTSESASSKVGGFSQLEVLSRDHVADSGEGDSQNEPSVTAPHDTGASSVTDAYPDTTASYQVQPFRVSFSTTAPTRTVARAVLTAVRQGEPAQQQLHLPDGWGAQWDEAAQAYYYYNGQGQTQWEAPAGSYMGPPAAAA